MVKAVFILTLHDIVTLYNIVKLTYKHDLKGSKTILFSIVTFIYFYITSLELHTNIINITYNNLGSYFKDELIRGLDSTKFYIFSIFKNGVMQSMILLLLILHFASSYFASTSAKRPIFSTYYLIMYTMLIFVWFLPELVVFKLFFYYMGGFFLLFLLVLKGLREDARIVSEFPIDPFCLPQNPYSFKTGKHYSIIFSFSERAHSPLLELIKYVGFSIVLALIFLDSREIFFFTESGFWHTTLLTPITIVGYISLLLIRQSAYPIFLWTFYFVYSIFWIVLGSAVLFSNDFSYFGLITQNVINETTAISSLGLISSFGGLESVLWNLPNWKSYWYRGEGFTEFITSLGTQEKFDNLQFTLEPFKMGGDMYLPPHMLTPSDDHNWTINTTFENNYFQSYKLMVTKSDSLQADTLRYWPIERNLHIWFGEFLEKDLYYGWSNRSLIDTEHYFDTSPYALSNILGDNFSSKFLIEVLNLFVGAKEYDSADEYSLDDWGHSHGPGSVLRDQWTFSTENKVTTLDSNQKSRLNDENYHEWFPGIYVLDGRFDVKKPIVHLRFFLGLGFIIFLYWAWSALNDIAPLNIIETISERDFVTQNFFIFGSGQTETISSFFWSKVFTSSFEWPVEPYIDDPTLLDDMGLMPSEEMFIAISPNNDDTSVLDSYFYIPIFKSIEGYSAYDYKKYLMPIFFPMSGKSLWASNVAREVNFEYSNIFEVFYNNITGFGDFAYKANIEYDGTVVSGSDDSSTGDSNKTESNDMFDDTIIDEPATESQADWTDPDYYLEEYFYGDYLDGRIDNNDSSTENLQSLWTTEAIKEKLRTIRVNIERPSIALWNPKFKNPKKKEFRKQIVKFTPMLKYNLSSSFMLKKKNSKNIVIKKNLNSKLKNGEMVVWGGVEYNYEKNKSLETQATGSADEICYSKELSILNSQVAKNENSNKTNIWAFADKTNLKKINKLIGLSKSTVIWNYGIFLEKNNFPTHKLVNYNNNKKYVLHKKNLIVMSTSKVNTLYELFKEEFISDRANWATTYNNKIGNIELGVNALSVKDININPEKFHINTVVSRTDNVKSVLRYSYMLFNSKFFSWGFWRLIGLLPEMGIKRTVTDFHNLDYHIHIRNWTRSFSKSRNVELQTFFINSKNINWLFTGSLVTNIINRLVPVAQSYENPWVPYYDTNPVGKKYKFGPIVEYSMLYNFILFRSSKEIRNIGEADKSNSFSEDRYIYIQNQAVSDYIHLFSKKNLPVLVNFDKILYDKYVKNIPVIKFFHYPMLRIDGKMNLFIINIYEGRRMVLEHSKSPGQLLLFKDLRLSPVVIKNYLMWDYRNPWVIEHPQIGWYLAIDYEKRLGIPYYFRYRPLKGQEVVIKKSWLDSLGVVKKIKELGEKINTIGSDDHKLKIDNEDTTTDSSSSTEDTSSSDETDTDETYSSLWDQYVEVRYMSMGGEEGDDINIHDYLEFLPLFSEGFWAGSDSEGTVVERNNSSFWTPPRKYKIFSGVFILNNHMYEAAFNILSDYGKRLSNFEKYINPFVSDDESGFYDDKVVTFRNLPLLWIEFTRHIYISRWRLQYNYNIKNAYNGKYPSAYLHEYYNFKYKIYKKFLNKIIEKEYFENSLKKNLKTNNKKWGQLKLILLDSKYKNIYKRGGVTSNSMEEKRNGYVRSIINEFSGKIRFVRSRFTHRMKESIGIVSYKRPYRIPVSFFDEITGKEVMYNTKTTWFNFIYMLDTFPEEEVVDKKFLNLNKQKRLDANLRYKRNWFFSNFMFEDKELMETRDALWPHYTDFDNDRKRSKYRNLKHGGSYRLNFNSELWWTKWDRAEHGFRRIDDLPEGILDFYGPATHLHGGIENIIFPIEDNEIFETTLPLFEKSLVDPESPAFGEDGEFPEFDENVLYNVEYKGGIVPDHLVVSDIENFNMWDEALLIESNIKKMKLKGFGSIFNNTNTDLNYDFNPLDIGDLVDILSNKSIHPIAYSADFIFDDNIDQKLEEAIIYYALTGQAYDEFFYGHDNVLDEKITIDWDDLDILNEAVVDEEENTIGLGYDLILLKKVKNSYWASILEADSNWEDLYQSVYPQIHDSVENMYEYLPVWNFDPSLWEYPGHEYNVIPLVVNDDSKLLINTKINRFDSNYNWLSSKDLTQHEVSSENNNWGGSDPLAGFNDQIDFDFFYDDEDVDSDVDIDVENQYLIPGDVQQNEFEDEEDSEDALDRYSESDMLDYYRDTDPEPNEKDDEDKEGSEDEYRKNEIFSTDTEDSTSTQDFYFHAVMSDQYSNIYKFYHDQDWQDYADSDDTTTEAAFYDEDTRGMLSSEDEEDEFYFDTADQDVWDVSIHFLDGHEYDEYSFVDWGQENMDPDGDTDDSETGIGQNYASTEGVYQDYMENDYAQLGREYPEEINFMLQDDQYDDLISELELTDLPDSVEISELDSVDSEFSISQFDESIIFATESTVAHSSIEMTMESSTDVASQETDENLGLFEIFDGEVAEIGWRSGYNSPVANPEIDLMDPPPMVANRPKLEFEDHLSTIEYQGEKMHEMFMKDWNDSSPIELEDTTRETESFGNYQKYIDSYRLESILDEIVFIKYRTRSLGLKFNRFDYFISSRKFWQKSFKSVLFNRTNYLANYRALMEELGLGAYSF